MDALFTELGLTWADGDYSTAAYEVRRRMSAEFVGACLAAARRLHEGVLPRLFDRDIPVIVHELEYYDEIARQNLACNEPALVWEFVRWVSPRGFEADSLDGR